MGFPVLQEQEFYNIEDLSKISLNNTNNLLNKFKYNNNG
jgi:hypothetical protein